MKNIHPYEAGNTLESYKQFVKKLTKRGAKEVGSPAESDVSIVFCPIVSRFETDVNAALSSAKGKHANSQKHIKMLRHVLDANSDVCFLSVSKKRDVPK